MARSHRSRTPRPGDDPPPRAPGDGGPRPRDGARGRHLRARLRVTVVILGLLVVASTALALTGHGTGRGPHPAEGVGPTAGDGTAGTAGATRAAGTATAVPGPPVTVTLRVARHARGHRVPAGFFGLSVEYWVLADDEAHPRLFERVLDLLHAHGTGPMTLRIGGNSSEVTFLRPGHGHLPSWAYGVGPGWIRRTARLVGADHLRVIADLNEATADPRQARALAVALERGLPRRTLAGLELGNEPDGYARSLWSPRLRATPSLALRARTEAAPGEYDAEYLAMARAMAGPGPGTARRPALIGPALAKPRLDVRWISALLAAPHPGLGAISVHEYPFSACAPTSSDASPTIGRLLSAHAQRAMASAITPAVAVAHRAHLPLRVTEFNSVTCGGRPGVSDSFASALWAPGALFEMLSAGARSAFLHARLVPANSPFRWDAAGLDAQPLLYGLLLFARALGPGARLEPLHLHVGRPASVSAWAIRLESGTEHLVVIDRGTHRVRLRLRVARSRTVSVGRLLAPDVRATHGVTLDGQRLDAAARWRGRRVITRVHTGSGHETVMLTPRSAALITIRAR